MSVLSGPQGHTAVRNAWSKPFFHDLTVLKKFKDNLKCKSCLRKKKSALPAFDFESITLHLREVELQTVLSILKTYKNPCNATILVVSFEPNWSFVQNT